MSPKTKRIVDIIAAVIPAGLVMLSGVFKFIGGEQVVQGFTALGVIQYLPVLGTAEICFALLYIPRKTMKMGFILLSCYFAGAMATELSHGMAPASPTITLSIIWISAFIRDRSIFLPVAERTQNA